jgi:hypothetical protein
VSDQAQGIVHIHDRRACWDCQGLGIVHGSISIKITEKTLVALGWRFLEAGGRMVCSECAWKRRHPNKDVPRGRRFAGQATFEA